MTTRTLSLALVFVLAAVAASAQGAGAPPAPQKISLSAGLQRSYEGIKRNLTEMAAKMPEADYAFQPTKDIRMFGQIFGHVANAQFGQCAAAQGVANPNLGKNLEELLTTKAEFVKALADSFTLCDAAFAALTDANAAELLKQGPNEVARGSILTGVIGHGNELYGTGAVYMRLKGLVPPSTERMQQMRRPGQ